MDDNQWRIEPGSKEPIYRQIADQVRRLVAAGQLQAGERLPSVRTLALRFGINPMTVSRAYTQLVDEGVVLRRRGSGMVVAARAGRTALTAEARMRLLETRLREVIREAGDLGLAAGPVCERLHALFLTPAPVPPKDSRSRKRASRPARQADPA